MAKLHVAIYGSTRMLRGYCPHCKDMALIVNEIYQCCDLEVSKNNILKRQKRMIEAEQVRRRPSTEAIRKMIALQGDKCLYCLIEFNTPYLHPRKKTIMHTKMCYDHFVPFKYSQDNRDVNFVLACGTCNGIKSDLVFKTVEEARDYVTYRRTKKGYNQAFAI